MTTAINRSTRVGLITDQTGPLSFMGMANVNVANMSTPATQSRTTPRATRPSTAWPSPPAASTAATPRAPPTAA